MNPEEYSGIVLNEKVVDDPLECILVGKDNSIVTCNELKNKNEKPKTYTRKK